jgi:hypothetical protein
MIWVVSGYVLRNFGARRSNLNYLRLRRLELINESDAEIASATVRREHQHSVCGTEDLNETFREFRSDTRRRMSTRHLLKNQRTFVCCREPISSAQKTKILGRVKGCVLSLPSSNQCVQSWQGFLHLRIEPLCFVQALR